MTIGNTITVSRLSGWPSYFSPVPSQMEIRKRGNAQMLNVAAPTPAEMQQADQREMCKDFVARQIGGIDLHKIAVVMTDRRTSILHLDLGIRFDWLARWNPSSLGVTWSCGDFFSTTKLNGPLELRAERLPNNRRNSANHGNRLLGANLFVEFMQRIPEDKDFRRAALAEDLHAGFQVLPVKDGATSTDRGAQAYRHLRLLYTVSAQSFYPIRHRLNYEDDISILRNARGPVVKIEDVMSRDSVDAMKKQRSAGSWFRRANPDAVPAGVQ